MSRTFHDRHRKQKALISIGQKRALFFPAGVRFGSVRERFQMGKGGGRREVPDFMLYVRSDDDLRGDFLEGSRMTKHRNPGKFPEPTAKHLFLEKFSSEVRRLCWLKHVSSFSHPRKASEQTHYFVESKRGSF
eukprot:scaffold1616_cov310-Pinguiococcus_pyrenoidosus.AAC.12